MTRQRKDRLRAFTTTEQAVPEQLTWARSAPPAQVARQSSSCCRQWRLLSTRCLHGGLWLPPYRCWLGHALQCQGLAALDPPHSGGPASLYTAAERARILAEARRTPNREQDGPATWSLRTLQRALQRAPDGLPHVSRYTLWVVLRAAGWHGQRHHSWYPTGSALRKRKTGIVTVHDPATTPPKT